MKRQDRTRKRVTEITGMRHLAVGRMILAGCEGWLLRGRKGALGFDSTRVYLPQEPTGGLHRSFFMRTNGVGGDDQRAYDSTEGIEPVTLQMCSLGGFAIRIVQPDGCTS